MQANTGSMSTSFLREITSWVFIMALMRTYMKLFPIFSRRIVRELEKQGFSVVKIAPNRNHPELSVYYFKETVALRNAAQQLISK